MGDVIEIAEMPKDRTPRRSAEEIAAEKKEEWKASRDRAKAVKRKLRTRKNIVLGSNLDSFAENGNDICKQALEIITKSLKRSDDRKLFDLPLLPEPVGAAAKNAELLARIHKSGPPSPEVIANRLDDLTSAKAEFGRSTKDAGAKFRFTEVVIAYEKASGEKWPDVSDRAEYGLSDRPGVRLGA